MLLLLKSSDRVAAETHKRLTTEVPFTLALNRWANLYPSMEFRAFVRENQVVAICQRDTKSKFEHLNYEREQILDDVVGFFDRHVAGRPLAPGLKARCVGARSTFPSLVSRKIREGALCDGFVHRPEPARVAARPGPVC